MQVLRGEINPLEERIKAIAELKQTVNKYSDRFIGFGACPAGLELEQTQSWIEEHIVNSDLKGIGEITLGANQIALTENIFKATAEYERLPLWFHTFNPLTSKDINDLIALAAKYPRSIVILGHGGGSYWLETLEEIIHLKNVYFDISASFTTHSVKIASEIIPERVLFSIDMPYGSAQVMKALVNDAVKDPGIRQLIFEQNIKNLLHL
jgi:predicted TIM-barrel fold metal-dependent hydrolase